jgi:transposase-like protein
MVIGESRSVADVARAVSVNEQTLRNWVAAYRVEHAGEEPPLAPSELHPLKWSSYRTRGGSVCELTSGLARDGVGPA